MDDTIAGKELQELTDRILRLTEEKKGLTQDIADIYLEAKGRGFDPKILKKVVARMAKNMEELHAEDGVLSVYERALRGE